MATEVWSALLNGRETTLRDLIIKMINSQLPADQARGIMAASFASDSEFSSDIFERFKNSTGLLANTVTSGRELMSRHNWACHWYRCMAEALSEEAYWCASMLYLLVVDGRSAVTEQPQSIDNQVFKTYWASTSSKLEHRFRKQAKKRSEKLINDNAPQRCFIEL